MLRSRLSKLTLCLAGVLALMGAGQVYADPVFASFDPADAGTVTGTLDGVSFTITGLSNPSTTETANLSGGNFSAGPGGSSQQVLAYAEKSNFTVTFASTIPDLYLYGAFWRPEDLADYSFTQPISILSGFTTATVNNGTDLVATNPDSFLNGIVELTNVTSFTVTPNFSDPSAQQLDFAAPVPEPGSFGLLALGAACLLFVRKFAKA
jgi:hypothetical protein